MLCIHYSRQPYVFFNRQRFFSFSIIIVVGISSQSILRSSSVLCYAKFQKWNYRVLPIELLRDIRSPSTPGKRKRRYESRICLHPKRDRTAVNVREVFLPPDYVARFDAKELTHKVVWPFRR